MNKVNGIREMRRNQVRMKNEDEERRKENNIKILS